MTTWQKLHDQSELIPQFLIREKVIDGIRQFFKKHHFHEVETPLLVKYPGTEPYLEVFETTLKTEEGDQERAFLLTSPEYAMKKLLVAGFDNIFQICKSFRNGEGIGPTHNHEFTILEWYRSQADYTDIMQDCEDLLLFLLHQLQPQAANQLTYQGREYDLSPHWPKFTVAELFHQYIGLTADQLLDENQIKQKAVELGYQINSDDTWETIYFQLFLNEIEPELAKLNRPVFVYEYPASQAALSKKKKSDPRFAERFELYLGGLELGNAFSELTDATEQQARFESELELRKTSGKTPYGLDTDFIEALQIGMPETGGIAVGVDRLVMLFADVPTIQDTLFFSTQEIFGL